MSRVEFTLGNPYSKDRLPKHVAIIMDGNGRWANLRRRPRVFGHKHGAERVREIVQCAGQLGIEVLTLYAFSDENWGRPLEEVGVIMQLLEVYLKRESEQLNRNNVRLQVIGDLSKVPMKLRNLIETTTKFLSPNTGLVLNVALSYGSRAEISHVVRQIGSEIKAGLLQPEDITHETITERLFTAALPDPDLIIRTSGEQRLSNFLLWQAAYAEFYFSPVLWPDFSRDEFLKALESFASRERRFGLTGGQIRTFNNLSESLGPTDVSTCS